MHTQPPHQSDALHGQRLAQLLTPGRVCRYVLGGGGGWFFFFCVCVCVGWGGRGTRPSQEGQADRPCSTHDKSDAFEQVEEQLWRSEQMALGRCWMALLSRRTCEPAATAHLDRHLEARVKLGTAAQDVLHAWPEKARKDAIEHCVRSRDGSGMACTLRRAPAALAALAGQPAAHRAQ